MIFGLLTVWFAMGILTVGVVRIRVQRKQTIRAWFWITLTGPLLLIVLGIYDFIHADFWDKRL